MSIAESNAAESQFWATHERDTARPDWDDLTHDEKHTEWENGEDSEFFTHPRFEPVYCDRCGHDVFLDSGDFCEWCNLSHSVRPSFRHVAAAVGGLAFAGVAVPYLASLI